MNYRLALFNTKRMEDFFRTESQYLAPGYTDADFEFNDYELEFNEEQ